MRRRICTHPVALGLSLAHNAQVLAALSQGCHTGIRRDDVRVWVGAVNHRIKRALCHEALHARLVQTLRQDLGMGERP